MAGLPREDAEASAGERIQQAAGALKSPSADDDGHHESGADGGRLPAGDGDVGPDSGQGEESGGGTREAQGAEEGDKDHADERDVKAADGEHVDGSGEEEAGFEILGGGGVPTEGHGPDQFEDGVGLG